MANTPDRIEEARGPRPDHRLRIRIPAEWRSEHPDETPEFSKPDAFQALLVCVAPYAPVIVTVAVRPAFGKGALGDHAARLCAAEGFEVAVRPAVCAGRPGVVCDGTQQSDMGPVRLRLYFFENAGTLWQVGTMAPAPLWTSVEPALAAVVESAELFGETPAAAAELALADDERALDPEEATNAWFRDQGVGLVPNVLRVERGAKCATVGAGAIEATFTVPFGWHVIDDGRRTLVFDTPKGIQVSLSARVHESRDPNEIFQAIFGGLQIESPSARGRGEEKWGLPCMIVEGLEIEGEALQQAYLLCDGSRPGLTIVTRVTATPADFGRAMKLAEVLLRDLAVMGAARV
jgi:hypothetical protein